MSNDFYEFIDRHNRLRGEVEETSGNATEAFHDYLEGTIGYEAYNLACEDRSRAMKRWFISMHQLIKLR